MNIINIKKLQRGLLHFSYLENICNDNSYLEAKSPQLEHKFEGKEDCKYYIQYVKELSVYIRLIVKLHGQTKCVY